MSRRNPQATMYECTPNEGSVTVPFPEPGVRYLSILDLEVLAEYHGAYWQKRCLVAEAQRDNAFEKVRVSLMLPGRPRVRAMLGTLLY